MDKAGSWILLETKNSTDIGTLVLQRVAAVRLANFIWFLLSNLKDNVLPFIDLRLALISNYYESCVRCLLLQILKNGFQKISSIENKVLPLCASDVKFQARRVVVWSNNSMFRAVPLSFFKIRNRHLYTFLNARRLLDNR